MKPAIYKLLLFLLPFIAASIFMIVIDPYNLFNISKIISDETKVLALRRSGLVSPREDILWKTIQFKRKPTPNIIIGDSRVYDISNRKLEENIGGEITNLGIPGANYRTIIDLFWMASESIELDNVILQVDFSKYNASINYDLFNPVRQVTENPYTFLFNWIYLKDSFITFYNWITKLKHYIPRFYIVSDEKWENSKSLLIKELITIKYIYPIEYYEGLKEISEFCQSRDINLILLIHPYYFEVHNFIREFNLEDRYNQFNKDINSLGQIIDLDNGIPFSFVKDNYSDHFHIAKDYIDTLVTMIFQYDLLDFDESLSKK